jgi:hypothetical protein
MTLKEMAYSRDEAMSKCYNLGKEFIIHFHKIYKEPNAEVVHHWTKEMQAWYDEIRGIVLKHNKKKLNGTQLRDWFFTAGGDPDDYFGIRYEDHPLDYYVESESYQEFIDNLLMLNDVYEALVATSIIKS